MGTWPMLLTVLDVAGTFVFALSGATKAVEHKLDLFGVLVLRFAAGNSGGHEGLLVVVLVVTFTYRFLPHAKKSRNG